ncbi:MAG: beta-galactosidase trimerization domain-containing protein, partial [Planctomycetes bacterium]|nr:beta-galactosidase trimerization domain-containing protein [Planctomycetota bacterium]
RHVGVDVVGPDRDLSTYRLVVLPSQAIVDPGLAARLRAFVAAGGTLLSLPQLACRDANAAYLPAPPPVGLEDVFGLRVVGGTYLRSFVRPDEALFFPAQRAGTDRPRLAARFAHGGREHQVEAWMEDLELVGATALAAFTDDLFAGAPAITENRHGAGRAVYVAGYPTDDLLDDLVAHLIAGGALAAGPTTPRWVEIVRRGDLIVIVNHRGEAVEVPMRADEVLVGTCADGVARLGAYDVFVARGRCD